MYTKWTLLHKECCVQKIKSVFLNGRCGTTSRSAAFSPCWVTWTTSAPQCSIMNIPGSSVHQMTRPSGFGIGRAVLASAYSLATHIMWCALSSTRAKTLLYLHLWIRQFVSGISQVLPASATAKVNISTCQRSGRRRWMLHFGMALWFLSIFSDLYIAKISALCFILIHSFTGFVLYFL